MSVLFRDVWLLDGSMEKACRADLLVQGEQIARIVPPRTLSGEGVEVIDGSAELLVMPGFFNAHCHAAMTLLRGLGEERPLMEWLEQRIWPVEAHLDGDIVYAGTVQAVCEMALGGTTGFADMYYFMDQVARTVSELKVRCSVGVGVVRDPAVFYKTLYRDYSDVAGPRIINSIDPHAPYTVSFDFVSQAAAEAVKRELPLQTHFLEAEWERGYITDTLKMTPVEYLEKTGLSKVQHLVLAHGVQFKEDELEYLAAHPNITVVHCPASNLKLGSGVALLPKMLEAGVHAALGTDGAASNNRLDMWNEIRLASLIHKGVNHDPLAVSSKQILCCATYEGARAFGFENVGMIREGWAADLNVIDLAQPHYLGVDEENMSSCVVFAGSSADVRHVLCGGDWIVRDRTFVQRDVKQIMEDSRAQRARLLAARSSI